MTVDSAKSFDIPKTESGSKLSWKDGTERVPQGSILGSLFFLIYINDLSEGLKSNSKLFTRDTSLFSVVKDTNLSQTELNEELAKVNNWAYQWKMSFNPDPSEQAQEVSFSRKVNKILHLPLVFNNSNVTQIKIQKHVEAVIQRCSVKKVC